MKEISAHDLMRSVFCRACGVHEVAREGDVCERCQSYLDSFSSNGSVPKPVIREQSRKVPTVIEAGLFCKWDGCTQSVSSHKGAANGFCVKLQPNGKTHRQMHLEKMREDDPFYGKKKPHSVDAPATPAPKDEPKEDSGISWLEEVREKIEDAMTAVEVAERSLEISKDRLREILVEAQEAVR